MVTVAATENNPEATGIDLRGPSLMNRIRGVRTAAADADAEFDLLAALLAGQKLFGGELG